MKLFLTALFSFSAIASADPNCGSLAAVQGDYVQTSNSCANDTGFTSYKFVDVQTAKVQEKGREYTQTWIHHTAAGRDTGGVGFGPTTQENDTYKCSKTGNAVSMLDPFGFTWSFVGDSLSFSSPFCTATFKKVSKFTMFEGPKSGRFTDCRSCAGKPDGAQCAPPYTDGICLHGERWFP